MPTPRGSCATRWPTCRRPTTGPARRKPRWRCVARTTSGWAMPPSRTGGWSAGSARSALTATAGRSIRWWWRQTASVAASAPRCCRRSRPDVLTLFLGSDDDWGGWSFCGRDLWSDGIGHIAATEATARRHALTFYRRHGFQIVGLLPDVNGAG